MKKRFKMLVIPPILLQVRLYRVSGNDLLSSLKGFLHLARVVKRESVLYVLRLLSIWVDMVPAGLVAGLKTSGVSYKEVSLNLVSRSAPTSPCGEHCSGF